MFWRFDKAGGDCRIAAGGVDFDATFAAAVAYSRLLASGTRLTPHAAAAGALIVSIRRKDEPAYNAAAFLCCLGVFTQATVFPCARRVAMSVDFELSMSCAALAMPAA